jgi:hypothetical protein
MNEVLVERLLLDRLHTISLIYTFHFFYSFQVKGGVMCYFVKAPAFDECFFVGSDS